GNFQSGERPLHQRRSHVHGAQESRGGAAARWAGADRGRLERDQSAGEHGNFRSGGWDFGGGSDVAPIISGKSTIRKSALTRRRRIVWSLRMHNGRDQAIPVNAFQWAEPPEVKLLAWETTPDR